MKPKFTLEDVFAHEAELARRHPQNHHIRETIHNKLRELLGEDVTDEEFKRLEEEARRAVEKLDSAKE
jgi:hypothetical protein